MSEIDILDKLNVLERRINELQRMEHTSTVARWTDYSATSTIVGWSSFTTKNIYYARIGNLVFVDINLVGTSNDTITSFTVPYVSAVGFVLLSLIRARDNTGEFVGGLLLMINGLSTINLYSTLEGASWTASGTKACEGQFWYWCA